MLRKYREIIEKDELVNIAVIENEETYDNIYARYGDYVSIWLAEKDEFSFLELDPKGYLFWNVFYSFFILIRLVILFHLIQIVSELLFQKGITIENLFCLILVFI